MDRPEPIAPRVPRPDAELAPAVPIHKLERVRRGLEESIERARIALAALNEVMGTEYRKAPVHEGDLSPAEREVLARLMQGMSNKEIARALDITETTVKVHLKHISNKVGTSNRTQIALWGHGVWPR